jgi:hypothetical protein
MPSSKVRRVGDEAIDGRGVEEVVSVDHRAEEAGLVASASKMLRSNFEVVFSTPMGGARDRGDPGPLRGRSGGRRAPGRAERG